MNEDIFSVLFEVPTILESAEDLMGNAMGLALGDLIAVLQERLIDATPMGLHQSRVLKSGKLSKAQPYIPGTAKKSWQGELQGDRLVFWNETPYIEVLEQGGYPGVGPRTEEFMGGVYSRQAVGGITAQLRSDQRHIDLIMDRIISEIEKSFGEATSRS